MPRDLVLVESGISPEVWIDFARKINSTDGCLVLAERLPDLTGASKIDFPTRWVDDYVVPMGKQWVELMLASRALADRLISQPPLSELSQYLEYDGLSMWEMAGADEIEWSTFLLLRKIESLRDVLSSSDWRRVYSLESDQALWQAFSMLAAGTGFSAEVRRVPMRGRTDTPGLPRRLYRSTFGRAYSLVMTRLTDGWGDQLMADIDNLRKSRRLPELRLHRNSARPFHLFIVGSYVTYFSTLTSVIPQMKASGQVLMLGHGDMPGKTQLQQMGTFPSYWSRYVPLTAWPGIIRRNRQLRTAWQKLENDDRLARLCEYKGSSLWPVIHKPLAYLFLHMFPRIMVWTEALKHIYRLAEPDALAAVPDSSFPARIAIALARRSGIPSLTVQAALISNHPPYGRLYADKVAVIDEYSHRVYSERGGIAPERLVLTGLPRWDSISMVNKESAMAAVRQRLGLSQTDRLVVFGTDVTSPSQTRQKLAAVIRAVSRLANTRLAIKVHPAEPIGYYRVLAAELAQTGNKPIIIEDIDLHHLLAAADLLVTSFSNIALEAALLDTPVVVINLTGEPDPLPFVADGIALGAYSEAEIERQVERLMNDKPAREQLRDSRRRYAQRNPQLLDGKATARVVNLLKEMAAR